MYIYIYEKCFLKHLRFRDLTLNHYHPFSIIPSANRVPIVIDSRASTVRALSLRKHVQTARVLFSSLTFRKRYYKYYARNRALRSTLFHARTGCDVQVTGTFDSNPLGHDTEYNGAGRGTRDELLCPPQKKKKKRCEKVYFVRRCVIRVITLTSLLPERERERRKTVKKVL